MTFDEESASISSYYLYFTSDGFVEVGNDPTAFLLFQEPGAPDRYFRGLISYHRREIPEVGGPGVSAGSADMNNQIFSRDLCLRQRGVLVLYQALQ